MAFYCGPTDPPQITEFGFDVNGEPGTPDFDADGGFTNPPTIGKEIDAFVEFTNSDETSTIAYRYFVEEEVGDVAGSNPYTPQEDQNIPGKILKCEIIVTNSVGSDSVVIDMGVVYGLPPIIPENLNSFASFSPTQGSAVLPGDDVTITYNNLLTDPGDPPPHTIETIINGQSFFGTLITFSYDTLDTPSCSPSIQRIEVSNFDENIPDTAFISKVYGTPIQIVGIQGPDGHPCGDPLGSCCVTGGFDPDTGITGGSCTQETEADCLALSPPGSWTLDASCPVCDGTVGTPCCPEIGTGRCCCVQFDNTGQCKDGIIQAECNSSNSDFVNCGGSTEYPDIVWTHNADCTSPEPPCTGPPTGRCCEYIPPPNAAGIEGLIDGFTCGTGLEEEGDCPRYPSLSTSDAWSVDGNCPDCRNPNEHTSDCCPTLGRCCVDNTCTPNQLRIDCPDNFDGTSNECPDCNATPGGPCCPALGRCCWKLNDVGDCASNVPSSVCDSLSEGSDNFEWTEGVGLVCPDCSGDQLRDNLCCDTSKGRCCTRTSGVNSCEDDVWYDDCLPPKTFGNGLTCPDCENDNDPDCCNPDVTIGPLQFTPEIPKVGQTLNVSASVSNNVGSILYTFYVDGEIRANVVDGNYAVPRNPSDSDAGKELTCTITAVDADGEFFNRSKTENIDGESFTMPDNLPATISVSPGSDWNDGKGKLNPGDEITVTITPMDVDPEINSIDWEFQQFDGTALTSDTGVSAVHTIPNPPDGGCELYINITFSNDTENAPSTTTASKRYKIGDIFNPTPNENCGDLTGACCRPDSSQDVPAEGIIGNKCDQQTETDCIDLDGEYQGDNTSCPSSCGNNSDGSDPCCPQIKDGTCCCTGTNNIGICEDGVIYADCNRSNSLFEDCAESYDEVEAPDGSRTGDPEWTEGRVCPSPGCESATDADGAALDRCCSTPTGRCCYIPSADAGPICEMGITEEDCLELIQDQSSGTCGAWDQFGSCPNCDDPSQNEGCPCCTKRGRCCKANDGYPNGYVCYDNITLPCCEGSQQGSGEILNCSPFKSDPSLPEDFCDENPSLCIGTYTSYNDFDDTNAPCPTDCESQTNSCCPDKGRCCFKRPSTTGDTDEGQRRGYCETVTKATCESRFESLNGIDGTYQWTSNGPVCVNGCTSNSDSCCDDTEEIGHSCNGTICRPSEQKGAEPAGYTWYDGSGCPDCTDPEVNPPNNPSDCCEFGYPSLGISRIEVRPRGTSNWSTYNPIFTNRSIKVGDDLRVIGDHKNVVADSVRYQFIGFDDQDIQPDNFEFGLIRDFSTDNEILDFPSAFTYNDDYSANGIMPVAGSALKVIIEGTPELDIDPPRITREITLTQTDDYINGIPPSLPDENNLEDIVADPFGIYLNLALDIDVPTSAAPGDVMGVSNIIDFGGAVPGASPTPTVSLQWTDVNQNDILNATNQQYTISGDGSVEGCVLGLKVTLKNDEFPTGWQVPNGAEVSKIFNMATIFDVRGEPSEGYPCGTDVGACCEPGGLVTEGQLSDGSPWGVTRNNFVGIVPLTECQYPGSNWDTDVIANPCVDSPNDHEYGQQGRGPCCDEIPGRCCYTTSEGNTCGDQIIKFDCDDLSGTWVSYYDDIRTCADFCDSSGESDEDLLECGCEIVAEPTGRVCGHVGDNQKNSVFCLDEPLGTFEITESFRDTFYPNTGVFLADAECPDTPCQREDPEHPEILCGCEPTEPTGRCCGMSNPPGGQNEYCMDSPQVTQSTCETTYGGTWTEDGSCSDVNCTSDPNNICCSPPTSTGSWVNYSTGLCSSTDNGGIYCDGPANVTLNSLTPCDFREIYIGTPPDNPCNIAGLCSCYDPESPGGAGYDGCGGKEHLNSPNGKNIIYLCEQIVKANAFGECDPVYQGGLYGWDNICADLAEDYCRVGDLLNPAEFAEALAVFDPIPIYEMTETGGSNPNTQVNSTFTNNWDCDRLNPPNPEQSCIDTRIFNPYYGATSTEYVWSNNCPFNPASYTYKSCKHNMLGSACTNCCCCPPGGGGANCNADNENCPY